MNSKHKALPPINSAKQQHPHHHHHHKPLTIINETIARASKCNHSENKIDDDPEISKFNLIKQRLNYLKLLQFKTTQLEVEFYQDLYMLEFKYSKLNSKLFDQRKQIINGEYEPTEEESSLDFIISTDPLAPEKEISRDLAALNLSQLETVSSVIKGIPGFWLNVLLNASLTSKIIGEHDKPILKHLTDISIDFTDQQPFSFTLKFDFSPNEYFSNAQLTKTYMLKIELNDPFIFEAIESQKSLGCCIKWYSQDKNVTQIGDEMQESFFNFFNLMDEGIEEDESDIALDHDIGYAFKEKIIPRAILYYLGELMDDDDDYLEDDYDQQDDQVEENKL